MAKKTNYFSHDSNARNDEKILAVRIKYGAEGYGIFFMILERLREQSDYQCAKDYNLIAFDLRVDAGKLKSIIEDFGLFAFTDDGKCFYSDSFKRRMVLKDGKSERAAQNANKRWNDANALQTHTKTDANALPSHPKSDASKVKKSKESKEEDAPPPAENFRIPTEQEVWEYFAVNGCNNKNLAKKFFNYYEGLGWKKGISHIQNWRAFANMWIANPTAAEILPKPTNSNLKSPDQIKREQGR